MMKQGSKHMTSISQFGAMARMMMGGRPAEAPIILTDCDNHHSKPPRSRTMEVRLTGRNGHNITICGTTIGYLHIVELLKEVDGVTDD